MKILALDPSGNFGEKEGNGTTGWAVFENGELTNFGSIKAEDFHCQEAYWIKIKDLIKVIWHVDVLVCESYKLFGHKAKQQSGSSLDTPQLIGYLRTWIYENMDWIKWVFQDPKDKVRVADEILVHMGILEQSAGGRYKALGRQTVIHERDAIRHGVFYHRYTAKKSSN